MMVDVYYFLSWPRPLLPSLDSAAGGMGGVHGAGAAIGNVYSIFMQVDQNHAGLTQWVWQMVSESPAGCSCGTLGRAGVRNLDIKHHHLPLHNFLHIFRYI